MPDFFYQLPNLNPFMSTKLKPIYVKWILLPQIFEPVYFQQQVSPFFIISMFYRNSCT